MPSKVTISDVAQVAGVSIATVSRVMNANQTVDPDLAQKVQQAADQLRYRPNAHARSIRSGQQRTIGLIVPSAHDNFFSKIMEGVLMGADNRNLRVVTFSCHGDVTREKQCLRAAAESGIGALLYCPSIDAPAQYIDSLFARDFPLVVLYRRDLISGVPHIYHDNISGGYLPTKYLLRHGHRNIAFFASFWQQPADTVAGLIDMLDSPNRGAYSSLDRLVGHMTALEESGVPFNPALVQTTGYDFDSGLRAADKFLSCMQDFDAIICSNDSVAAGVLQALREQNISVPEQVSLIGYDDSVFATIARPMLTSVRQEPLLLGEGAVDMVCEIMAGKKVASRILDVNLVVRSSTSVKRP